MPPWHHWFGAALLAFSTAQAALADESQPAPPEAKLWKSIAFDGFVANEVYPADLDGDGRLELLCLQSPGCYQSNIFNDTKYVIPAEERQIYCLTAITLDGKVLWQFGTPNLNHRQSGNHVADQMVWYGLLENGGRPEIALIKGSQLIVLDARSGTIKRSADLKFDNYTIVRGVRSHLGNRLLVQNTEKAYEPYTYGLPAMLYRAVDLKPLALIVDVAGSGHSPRAVDLNGDGNDELLIGFDAYDAEGNHLWRVENLGEVDPIRNHVDQLQVGRIGPNGEVRIVYAASFDVVIATPEGKLIFKKGFGHPQHVVLGDFRDGDKQASIAVFCCYDRFGEAQDEYLKNVGQSVSRKKGRRNHIAFLNSEGEIVNLIFPPNIKYHSGEGILLYPQGCPNGSDAVITRDWPWPEAYGLSGETVFTFPRPAVAPPAGENEPHGPGPDGYGVRIADFGSDSRAEVLIHDQTTAWIYRPPFPEAGREHTHDHLEPITGQGNYGMKVK